MVFDAAAGAHAGTGYYQYGAFDAIDGLGLACCFDHLETGEIERRFVLSNQLDHFTVVEFGVFFEDFGDLKGHGAVEEDLNVWYLIFDE